MTDTMKVIIGVLLPFLGTSLGAASVFFMKGEMNPKLQKALLGFASGVMVAASVWSLIMPGIEMAEAAGKIAWLPAAAGFLGGMFFLLILDSLIPHLHLNSDKPEGRHTTLGKSFMLVFAVALHNLPEGMAVGVVLAAMLRAKALSPPPVLSLLQSVSPSRTSRKVQSFPCPLLEQVFPKARLLNTVSFPALLNLSARF